MKKTKIYNANKLKLKDISGDHRFILARRLFNIKGLKLSKVTFDIIRNLFYMYGVASHQGQLHASDISKLASAAPSQCQLRTLLPTNPCGIQNNRNLKKSGSNEVSKSHHCLIMERCIPRHFGLCASTNCSCTITCLVKTNREAQSFSSYSNLHCVVDEKHRGSP